MGNIGADPIAFPLHLRKKAVLCSFGGAGRGEEDVGPGKMGCECYYFSRENDDIRTRLPKMIETHRGRGKKTEEV